MLRLPVKHYGGFNTNYDSVTVKVSRNKLLQVFHIANGHM